MLDFTNSEKRAIVLTVIILCGAGLIKLIKSYAYIPVTYDYSKSDSIFSRLSTSANRQNHNSNAFEVKKDIRSNRLELEAKDTSDEISNNKTISTQRSLLPSSININEAGFNELQKLPRIGPAIANRIVEYRKNHGRFNTFEELKQIKGIGKHTLEKIRPYLKKID